MRLTLVLSCFLLLFLPMAQNSYGQLHCIAPVEPPNIKIDKKQEPELYEHVRSEYQFYIEEMEAYLRCLEQERSFGLKRITEINRQYHENFGDDAVFSYSTE